MSTLHSYLVLWSSIAQIMRHMTTQSSFKVHHEQAILRRPTLGRQFDMVHRRSGLHHLLSPDCFDLYSHSHFGHLGSLFILEFF